MVRISVFQRSHIKMTDTYLKQMVALGADCLDFGHDTDFPGVAEQGYPDLDAVIKMRRRIRSFGLDINRVTLPNITQKFMQDQDGGGAELENTTRALQVFAEAGIPIIPGDGPDRAIGWAYSIGYIKALLAALVA